MYAFFFAALLHQCRREPQEVLARLDTSMDVAQEQGFGRWLAGILMVRGWALAQQGAVEEGIAQIQQGLTTWRTLGNEVALPHYLTMLAEVYGQGGETEAGLRVLIEAQTIVDKNLERRFEAEIWRLKGALLLQYMQAQDSTSPISLDTAMVAEVTRAGTTETVPLHAAAERCLLQAINVARQQQVKCLELRAIVSLVRLWQAEGKRAAACQMLAENYGWFTEGFDTPDLREAQALLRVLQ
jgi:predicted ATPase